LAKAEHPHLFPNLFKYAFVFCASRKKRKADEKQENQTKFSTQPKEKKRYA